MTEEFITYLIEKQKLTPEQVQGIMNLMQSSRYLMLQAAWLDYIKAEGFRDVLTTCMNDANGIPACLADKNVLAPEAMDKVKEEIRRNTRLLEQIILDMGIMGREDIERIMNDFHEAEAAGRGAGIAQAGAQTIQVFVSSSDAEVRDKLCAMATSMGHKAKAYSNTFDMEKALRNGLRADLLLCDVTEEGLPGVEAVGHLLRPFKNMKAAVFSDDADDYSIPEKLMGHGRFSLDKKNAFFEKCGSFIQGAAAVAEAAAEISTKETAAASLDEAAATQIEKWVKSVKVDYTPQGVMLHVDRRKVPYIGDRFRMSPYDKAMYQAFFESVKNHIQAMRVEQVDPAALEVCVWYPWNAPVRIAPQQAPTRDAAASVKLSGDGDRVIVGFTPASGRGRQLARADLMRKIKDVTSEFFINEDTVDRILESTAPLSEVPVAEKRDAEATIEFSPDEIEAYLTLRRAYGGKTLAAEDILGMARDIGIKEGLIKDNIDEACYSGVWNKKVTIARGKPVKHGKNGIARYLMDEKSAAPAAKNGSGSVDHRVVTRLQKVYAGESIIAIEPPTDGTPGLSVRGETVRPEPGRPMLFSFSRSEEKGSDIIVGENVEVLADFTGVVSKIDGVLHRDGREVSVSPMFEIKGDVDFSVGNIDVHGDLFIRGSVLSKFEVRASGDVYIQGTVEDAIVESGRSVFIEQGIFGNKKAIVFAASSVESACIEQANVFCLGLVRAKRSISHSNVVAMRAVEVTDPEGFIVGGMTKAGIYVSSSKLGSPAATATQIEAGNAVNMIEEMARARELLLKKMSIGQKHSRSAGQNQHDGQENSEAAEDAETAPQNSAKEKYSGYAIKTYDRFFFDWMDRWLERNRGRNIAADPVSIGNPNLKVIGTNHTFPGVNLKINVFYFNVKTEMAGKRVFRISGDEVVEST